MFILKKLLSLFSILFAGKTKEKIDNSLPQPEEKKKMKKGIIVCLDAGHGGADPGAIHPKKNPKYIESHLVLEICEHLAYSLDDEGYDVTVTRADNDSPISKIDRINRIKAAKADLLISIHCNSFHKPAYGIETLYNSSNPDSMKLAKNIQKSLKTTFVNHKDRGIKVRDKLYVLKTMSPSALVEVEFINTAGEFIQDNTEELAQAIFEGIENFYKEL